MILLQLYLCIGLAYGAWVIASAELAERPTSVMAMPLRLRIRIHLTVLALGTILWPVALRQDFRSPPGRR